MEALYFFIALRVVFFAVSLILIIRWTARHNKLKKPKAIGLVIPTIFLGINLLMSLVSFSGINALRYENDDFVPDPAYSETGVIICWSVEDMGISKWFELDGVTYVKFSPYGTSIRHYLDYGEEHVLEPIADIVYKPHQIMSRDFILFLTNKESFYKRNIALIYPVQTCSGFRLLHVENDIGSGKSIRGIFCAQEDLKLIEEYYDDFANYDTQNLICRYAVYSEYGFSTLIKKEIVIDFGVFEEIYALRSSDEGLEEIEISQEYIDIENAKEPGTSVYGYQYRHLIAHSLDEIVYTEVYLLLIDGRVYLQRGVMDNSVSGYALPDELNEHMLSHVFIDLNN